MLPATERCPAPLSTRGTPWPTRLRFALEQIYELDPNAESVALVELRDLESHYPSPGALQRHLRRGSVEDQEEDVWLAERVHSRWMIQKVGADGSREVVYVQPPRYTPKPSSPALAAVTPGG